MAQGRKAEKEAEDRARHLQLLNEAKAKRRNEPALERKDATKDDMPKILIVCEGKNTEPSYFEKFKLATAKIVVLGKGYNTTSLVRQAQQLSQLDTYAQVWCVFDRDEFTAQNFNKAITTAETAGFGVAYSNQSFEYWLILHFDDHQGGGMHRRDYHGKINSMLKPFGLSYEGEDSKVITEDIFDLVMEITDEKTKKSRLDLAIERAERNYNQFDHNNPATEESSTTVFRLAKELLKYI
jgi:hypothetical protein